MEVYCYHCVAYVDSKRCAGCNYRYRDKCLFREAKIAKIKAENAFGSKKRKQSARKTFANQQKSLRHRKSINDIAIKASDAKPIISKVSVLVRSHANVCRSKGHNIENVVITINILSAQGIVNQVNVSGMHCLTCGLFYISNSDFELVRRKGIILCRVVEDIKDLTKSTNGRLQTESLLHQYGYNVNAKSGITSIQRQKILSLIIDEKIMSKYEIISHITWLISMRKNANNMKDAIQKWNEDLTFVRNYDSGGNAYEATSIHRIVYNKI